MTRMLSEYRGRAVSWKRFQNTLIISTYDITPIYVKVVQIRPVSLPTILSPYN